MRDGLMQVVHPNPKPFHSGCCRNLDAAEESTLRRASPSGLRNGDAAGSTCDKYENLQQSSRPT